MKTVTKFFLLFLLITLFTGCNDDNNYYEKYWVNIATVQNPDSVSTFFFRLDNNDLMWTEQTNFRDYRPKDGQRIIANYTILSDKRATGLYDYDVKLNDVYPVLTKGIFQITPATQDSIGNDSIYISDMWIGSDYLNVEFQYEGYNQTHYINLVSDTSKVYTDGKIHLEFRHNANNDAPYYYRNGIVSFNLKSLQADSTSGALDLVISVNVPNKAADETYELTYKYGDSTPTYRSVQFKYPFDINEK